MTDLAAVALALAVLFALMLGTVYLALLIAPRRRTPYKLMRYEAGNPEAGPAKAPLAMQYLGYLLMLVTLEPVAAIPIAIYMLLGDVQLAALSAAACGAASAAAFSYAYHHARRVERWRV
ncbi:MAG: NADH-quinone oxidoreductase subunit A [Thermoproteaceae archaeon]|nr:NADH-quinone oxidoreductase subunit A [Thermoproteaceae archaeon]